MRKFDGLTDDERAAYPSGIRRLLASDGELRAAFDSFREQPFRRGRGRELASLGLCPLRHWGVLHEHVYAFGGALTKMTSIDREWAFRCEVKLPNVHARRHAPPVARVALALDGARTR